MSIVNSLCEIYSRYGYETKQKNENYCVFCLRQGVYYGIDIVVINFDKKTDTLKQEYEKTGYATRIVIFKNIDDIDSLLFEGFFETESTKESLLHKYHEYCESRKRSYGFKYSYIPCPYRVHDETAADNIIDEITHIMQKNSPELILIEAAAGYGKTSTSYEVLFKLLNCSPIRIPIFAELSRNRQAKIFRYVLLDEIDRLYPLLKSSLVEYEIKAGKIPLIIDGFDELLQQGTNVKDEATNFTDVEAMLDTIGDLLTGSAKIILTSRRTAIFAGDDFHNWMNDKSAQFQITRIKIDRPDIAQWIGHERLKALNEHGVPINHLSNPVLLTYIQSIDDSKFQVICDDIEKLIDNFFISLLEREQERQNLRLSVPEQKEIFINLAQDMVSYDITSDEKNFIKGMIIEKNSTKLNEFRSRYNPSERPSLDELGEILTNHVLLDRVGSKEDNIGFINQFVFGYLIGSAAIIADDDWLIESFANKQFISLASTAFSVRGDIPRNTLFQKICLVDSVLDDQDKLIMGTELTDSCTYSFDGALFDSLVLTSCVFSRECIIKNTLFHNCRFEQSVLERSAFINVNFVGCTFNNCHVNTHNTFDYSNCWFTECEDYESNFISNFNKNIYTITHNENINYSIETEILRQFWPIGRQFSSTKLEIRTLFSGFDSNQRKIIPEGIRSLKEKNLISTKGLYAFLNIDKINDIKTMVGK